MQYSTVLALAFLLATMAAAEPFCRPGTFHDGDTCKLCPRGQFQDKPNQTSCQECEYPLVSTKRGSTRCEPCTRLNEVPNFRNTRCICELFTARDPDGHCIPCPTSSHRPDGRCEPCPPDTLPFIFYKPPGCETCGRVQCCKEGEILVKNGLCGKCPPGHTVSSFRGCARCSPGTFKAGFGQQRCEKCPKNTFSGKGASSCIPCPPGKVLMKNGKCRSCKPGHFFDVDSMRCKPCRPGTFRRRRGAFLRCRPCPEGFFSGSGATKCITCPPETVLLLSGHCGNCPSGTRYIESSLHCASM